MPAQKKIAVVTGGASGIGEACVSVLGDQGILPVVVDSNIVAANEVARSRGTAAFRMDVSSERDIESVAERIEQEIGPVSMLVNCAGIFQKEPLSPEDLSYETWDRVIAVNLRGTYACCRTFGSRMANRGSGSIVNISSMAGMRSMPFHAYGPAKAAIINLTECLAAEWGRSGVRVNTISPGHVLTPALKDFFDRGLRDPEEIKKLTATGRIAEPQQIARAIAFLLSDDAGAITGVNLPVDNGFLLAGTWQPFGGCRPKRV